jgi:uncharacterized protein with NRDE domain
LLIVLAQVREDLPLVVAANRDERLDRPAVPMTVLRESGARVLGGRDELADGTWLAVNEAGVVAGLTNRPTSGGPDPAKRSRGELPLALTAHDSAEAAVRSFASTCRPSDYNPAWLLVGDRRSVFSIDIATGDRPAVERLGPGVHILENRHLGEPSPKVDRVRTLLEGIEAVNGDELVHRLAAVLADHHVPPGLSAAAAAGREDVPAEAGAACVHIEGYGTRWSCIVRVPSSTSDFPAFEYAPDAPCRAPFVDATTLFSTGLPAVDLG